MRTWIAATVKFTCHNDEYLKSIGATLQTIKRLNLASPTVAYNMMCLNDYAEFLKAGMIEAAKASGKIGGILSFV